VTEMVISDGDIVGQMVLFNPFEYEGRTELGVDVVDYPDGRAGYIV